jgi:CO dehydrogenase/acetyl-CoA synthase beta subunit
VNFTCVTTSPELIDRDEILLYGPDLGAIRASTPFARLTLLRVGDIESDDDDTEQAFRAIQNMDFVKYRVFPKGYMIRTSSENHREQVRISKDAIRRGISFERIGNSFLQRYKQDPNIISAKVIFITAPDADYAGLQKAASQVGKITMSLTKIMEGMSTDCSSCMLKPICDEVEGMKELHFGKEKHTTE